MKRIAGIDGGGTRTRAAIADGEGRVLGTGEAGPGNLFDVGPERLAAHLRSALETAWAAAGEPARRLDAIFLGLASVGRPAERERVRELVLDQDLARAEGIGIDHDLRIALAGGLEGAPGIALIAGTGSACFGRDGAGRSESAGGWGPFLDDAGSAFELGQSALRACVRAHDGRAARPSFCEPILERLELRHWHEIPARVASAALGRAQIAGLALLVSEAAEVGDPIGLELVQHAAREQARLVSAVARKLDWSDPPVALCGGMLSAGGLGWRALLAELERCLPRALPTEPLRSPVEGAVLLARELLA